MRILVSSFVTSWSRRIVLLLLLVVPAHQVISQNVELTASSQFNMVLGPISRRLGLDDLQVIEDGITSVLVSLVEVQDGDETDSIFLSMETVVQESDYLDTKQPSSQIRFFVLATTTSTTPSSTTPTSPSPRAAVNKLIQDSLFGTETGKQLFMTFLKESNSTVFEDVDSSRIKVVPLIPPASTSAQGDQDASTSSRKRKTLSNLDIILISVSGLIFVGICYMIFQHHKDRGYFEHQRVSAANQPIHESQTNLGEEDSTPRSIHIRPKHADMYPIDSMASQEAPSTPSTIHSTDFFEQPLTPPEFRVTPRNLTSTALLSAAAMDGASVHSITESLDSMWFGTSKSSPADASLGKHSTDGSQIKSSESNHTDDGTKSNMTKIRDALDETSSVTSDESEDVFFVDVENASSTMAVVEPRRSNKTAISEWMKTIRVVSTPSALGCSDTRTSDMTQSSFEASSTFSGPSTAQTSLDATSIEQKSLERSMASSKVDVVPRRGRAPRVDV